MLQPFSKSSKYGPYFAHHPETKDKKICLLCHAVVPSKTHNTDSMKNHIKTKHGSTDLTSKVKPRQSSIRKYMAKKEAEITEDQMLVNLVAKTMMTPHAIEKSKAMQYLFKKTYGKNFTQHQIWSAVERVNGMIEKDIIDKLKGKNVSITLDDWTARPNVGYANINANIREENGLLKGFSLGLVRLNETDGASLAEAISQHLRKFGIKPTFVTTDGASNMKTMSVSGSFEQQLCFLHGINLMVQDLINPKKNKYERKIQ